MAKMNIDDFQRGLPTIEELPKIAKSEMYTDSHINFWDDRKTMLEWATGKRGKRAALARNKAGARRKREAKRSSPKGERNDH